MKRIVLEFFRRGVTACGLGPVVLAVLYLVLQRQGIVEMLSVREVCLGIISLTVLAFIAGGLNVVYQVEQLPLMAAVSIHGAVLYVSYLLTYLINGWLKWGTAPILAFSAIFVGGYLVIWVIIYAVMKKKTERVNAALREKQKPQ